ncbi:MAG: trigger factor [Spirochaetales bacterium]|jgi:trigger factor|nr:trigger factor [Spirochaetales bacterium]
MIANKEIEVKEKSSVKLTITVGKDEAKKEYDELLSKYSKTAQIKGFRRGKVPTSILEQKFGESLRGEAGMNIIENSLKEAFEEIEKKPLQFEPPELLEEVDFELGKDFTFSVTYDCFPDVALAEYKGVEIEEPAVSILAEDINRELETIRDQNSVVIDKVKGGVEKENIVTVNYVELDDAGEEIPDSSREDFVFTVGTGYNRYKIDDELLDLDKDAEKEIEKSYPEDFEEAELAGKTVKLKVKVTQIKEKQLPELDDELAQDVSEEYKTLDDLKKSIKKRLKETVEQQLKQRNIDAILKKILESMTIDLPESMITAELASSWSRFMQQSGLNEQQMEQVLAQQERGREDLYADWRPSAEDSIKTRLILNEVLEAEKLKVTEEEIDGEITKSAEQMNMTAEQAREQFQNNNMMAYLENQLVDRKLYDFLLENAVKTKGKKIKFLDLVQNNQ